MPTILPLATPAQAAACHGNISCLDSKSCGSWSTFYSCDTPYCEYAPTVQPGDFASHLGKVLSVRHLVVRVRAGPFRKESLDVAHVRDSGPEGGLL